MDQYRGIFNRRGQSYDDAMQLWPRARDLEFQAIVKRLPLPKSCAPIVVDVPAGGGYLKSYIDRGWSSHFKYIGFEFCEQFNHSTTKNFSICTPEDIPLENKSADVLVCLAALHHVSERKELFSEVYRVLKPGGSFLLADVVEGQVNGNFLNQFVNEHNSMGHCGDFLNPGDILEQCQQTGFQTRYQFERYDWAFPDRQAAGEYIRKLFFLDKNPSDAVLFSTLEEVLGANSGLSGYQVPWTLGIFHSVK